MTTIIGAVIDGHTVLAADRQTTSWNQAHQSSKIFKWGDALVAECGSVRHVQVMQYLCTPERFIDGDDPLEWWTKSSADVYGKLNELGLMDGNDGHPSASMGLLIGIKGHLLSIYNDLSALDVKVAAMGSGGNFAMGHLPKKPTEASLIRALEKSTELDLYTGLGIQVASTADMDIRTIKRGREVAA